MTPQPETKTEYRVVETEGAWSFVVGGPYDDEHVAGRTVDDLRRNGGADLDLRIQTRTVTKTPWEDVNEPVTEKENLLRGVSPMAEQARQTHCKRGHPLSGENLKIRTDGSRQCKQCARYRERRRQRKTVEAGGGSE